MWSPLDFMHCQVGSMVTYILDAMQYREGSFAALWITLVAVHLGLLLSDEALSPLRSAAFALVALMLPGLTLPHTSIWELVPPCNYTTLMPHPSFKVASLLSC